MQCSDWALVLLAQEERAQRTAWDQHYFRNALGSGDSLSTHYIYITECFLCPEASYLLPYFQLLTLLISGHFPGVLSCNMAQKETERAQPQSHVSWRLAFSFDAQT